ncbi:MAG: ABC transporter ATP-binding protein [Tissierellia bacterium]|nr:ABC transporter ATP-binding protein [Tissierellia bacterium]
MKKILRYAKSYKWLIILSCVLSALSAILSIIPFVCIYNIINIFLKNLQTNTFYHYSRLAVYSAALSIFLYFIALIFSHLAAFRVAKNLKIRALNKIIEMPLGYFELRSSGELRKIIDENTLLTEDFLAHKLPDLSATLIMPLAIISTFFYFDWRLGAVCFIPLVISYFCLKAMMGGENKNMMGKIMTAQEKINKEAVEYVRGIPIIKVFQQTVFSFKRFHSTIIEYRDLTLSYAKSCQIPKTIFTVSLNSFFLFLIIMAVYIYNHTIDKSEVFLNLVFFILLSPLISTIMMRLMMTGENLIQAKEAVDRIEAIATVRDMNIDEQLEFPKNGDIRFVNVSFSYPDQEQRAIKNISFEIKSGTKVGIVGHSGSGKSTILSLLGRFFEIDSGNIYIDNVNLKNISHKAIMKNISFVFQDSQLFNISLLENIRIGNNDADLDEVKKALKTSRCEDIVAKFPEGLESIYGSKGIYLSGGERQRIALARAFLKDSNILAFDEATSGCDSENEYYINQAIKNISNDKTIILVAHRLSSVIDCDNIIVMDNGNIIEQGNHKDLLKLNGLYKKMWDQHLKTSNWRL